jgi:hypothetical protein
MILRLSKKSIRLTPNKKDRNFPRVIMKYGRAVGSDRNGKG